MQHAHTNILTMNIKSEARRLGFFACGMAKAAAVDTKTTQQIQQWLLQQGHADMHYMADHTDLRLDPRLLMPGTKTVVSLAMNYTPPQQMPKHHYQIAAYAYGKDYHDVVRERLYQLLAYIKTQVPDVEGRVCCDTAPILERYWAQQAGIGWIGRHRQLIIPPTRDTGEEHTTQHPREGNDEQGTERDVIGGGTMFFLGELLLNITLQYDQPVANRCGTCRRCINACPTKALEHDVFMAEHCLSYQLIENRGELSEEARLHMGNTIYGCDRCQKACPWNHYARPTEESALHPSAQLLNMTNSQWEQLDEDTYRKLFKGSAVKRVKYAGLKRNIDAASPHKTDD